MAWVNLAELKVGDQCAIDSNGAQGSVVKVSDKYVDVEFELSKSSEHVNSRVLRFAKLSGRLFGRGEERFYHGPRLITCDEGAALRRELHVKRTYTELTSSISTADFPQIEEKLLAELERRVAIARRFLENKEHGEGK